LSFNCIKEVSGLSQLTNLTDLTLSNNQLVRLSGLENLRELVFLSLNNNKITKLGEMISHLKILPKLQVLNCTGNTFINDKPNYVEYLTYYLKDLKYIDSQFRNESMEGKGGDEKYKLDELEEKQEDLGKKKEEGVMINERDFIDNHLKQLIRYDDYLLPHDNAEFFMITKNEDDLFEMPRSAFRESVRNLCNQALEQIKIIIRDINDHIEEFEKAVNYHQKKAHDQILMHIQVYFKKKKKVKLAFEDNLPGWQQDLENLLMWMNTEFSRELMRVEADLMSTFSKVNSKLISGKVF
jgi:Leucine-rich repeat